MSTKIMSECWPVQVSPTQKAVLISLADQANDEGYCWPSMATIATRTCLSERAVRGAIRSLEELGFVESKGRSGTSTYYRVTPAGDAAPARHSAPAGDAGTPAGDAGEGGSRRRGPRQELPPNRKEPSLNHQEPSVSGAGGPVNVSPGVWVEFVKHRKAIRKKLTPKAVDLIAKKLHGLSPPLADRCLEISIENGWTGVFPKRVTGGSDENRSGNPQQSAQQRLSVAERVAIANGLNPDGSPRCVD